MLQVCNYVHNGGPTGPIGNRFVASIYNDHYVSTFSHLNKIVDKIKMLTQFAKLYPPNT